MRCATTTTTEYRQRRPSEGSHTVAAIALRDRRMIVGAARRRFHPALSDSDLDELFDDACVAAVERCRGREDAVVRSFVTSTLFNKAKMELRSRRRHPSVSLEPSAGDERSPAGGEASWLPLGAEPVPVEDRAAIREQAGLAMEIVALLPERRREVVWMRYGEGLAPDEVQSALGLSSRQYAREIERGMAEVGRLVELVRSGDWCAERRSLLLAYAACIASADQERRARAHLTHCAGCRRMVAEERRRTAVRPMAAARSHAA
jgi:RNA polymerase sigma factor (sigma-70 family)